MSVLPLTPARPRARLKAPAGALGLGVTTLWLSVIVLLPVAALAARSLDGGLSTFWHSVTAREALSALRFSLIVALLVAAINAVMGTAVAWVLVRDDFRGRRLLNAVVDLPFALPTIVVGIVLLAIYHGVAFTQAAVALALLFVTLPFVIRSVQPVLAELDRDMEEAAASLGASPPAIFARIVLPNLAGAIVSGAALAFARAVGEFGSVVLISGNIPFHTEVSSVYVSNQIESDNPVGAAAVSVVLLIVSLLVLLLLRALERRR